MNNVELPKSRLEAAEAGSLVFSGNPCKRGHDGIRYTRSGACVHCIAESNEKLRLAINELLNNNRLPNAK